MGTVLQAVNQPVLREQGKVGVVHAAVPVEVTFDVIGTVDLEVELFLLVPSVQGLRSTHRGEGQFVYIQWRVDVDEEIEMVGDRRHAVGDAVVAGGIPGEPRDRSNRGGGGAGQVRSGLLWLCRTRAHGNRELRHHHHIHHMPGGP